MSSSDRLRKRAEKMRDNETSGALTKAVKDLFLEIADVYEDIKRVQDILNTPQKEKKNG